MGCPPPHSCYNTRDRDVSVRRMWFFWSRGRWRQGENMPAAARAKQVSGRPIHSHLSEH
jgi:hypothetical protein